MRGMMRRLGMCCAAVATALTGVQGQARAHEGGDCSDDESNNSAEVRATANRKVEWVSPLRKRERPPVAVQLLGMNDFHGQLSAGRRVANRPAGGAAVLASYLKSAAGRVRGGARSSCTRAITWALRPPTRRCCRTSRRSPS